ncbi:MAG: EAL domain-containing protein [Clostridiales bacterium]|nr:EAL domain-containing protein [Clostridiales bacterium]
MVFGLLPGIALKQLNLVFTDTGWINIPNLTFWEIWYRAYYIVFGLTTILLIWHWGWKSKLAEVKKQAYMILVSYILSLLLGTFTDIVFNGSGANNRIPEIAPLVVFISVATLFYCIKKYGLLLPNQRSNLAEEGDYLSEAARSRLYDYLSLLYFSAAFLVFAIRYFIDHEKLVSALLFSSVITVFGLLIYISQNSIKTVGRRELAINIILAATIPVIILQFMEFSAGYAWIVPLVFILISIASNNGRTIVFLGISIFLTYGCLWVVKPVQRINFEGIDHFIRMAVFLLIIIVAAVLNRIFRDRLKQYESQIKLQMLNASISSDIATVNEGNLLDKMEDILKNSCDYIQVDRADVIFFKDGQKDENTVFEWCGNGIVPIDDVLRKSEVVGILECIEEEYIPLEEVTYLKDTAELSETSKLGTVLKKLQIKSLISVPLTVKGKAIGLLLFQIIKTPSALMPPKDKSRDTRQIMKIIGQFITDAWLKVEAERGIRQMAYYDTLTGLPNRVLFGILLEKEISLAVEEGKRVCVIYLDIDFFKTINDIMGHDSGDTLLVRVAEKLSGCLRKEDTIGRFGGDEFLITLPHFSDIQGIKATADRILNEVREPLHINSQELVVTVSMGIAVFPEDGESPEELIKNADLAMYTAKQTGKNRYTICSHDIKEEFIKGNELTNSLYLALEREEFLLHYQPKVDGSTGKITGLEALARWQHPQKGLLMPGSFIPLAEKVGVIGQLDKWVLRTACLQNMEWGKKGLPMVKMAVNFSLSQFYNENVLESITEILKETGMDPAFLEIEITESIAYHNTEWILEILNGLKAMGISIAIDDFGTKYSSLSRLNYLPIDRIKIDRYFVLELSNGSKGENIMRAIFALSKTLGLKITVEGVETVEQLTFLRELSCDELQGYYFYRPMPSKAVEDLLAEGV